MARQGESAKFSFHRSGRYLILTGLSITVSFLIGALDQFWVFGLFFGLLLLSLCLWHYLTWNSTIKFLIRNNAINMSSTRKEAWSRINTPHETKGLEEMLYNPNLQAYPWNIWHKHDKD